jgi:polysaccharide export outer membrane protein
MKSRNLAALAVGLGCWAGLLAAQSPSASLDDQAAYILGPEDMVTIRVLNLEELGEEPYRVDLRGNVTVPRAGRVHAAGLTVEEFEAALADRFKDLLQEPVVTVTVKEFRSQRVSVLGAVTTPGVHQIQGRKTLFEVISEAGGLKNEAGNAIKITRRKENGPLPLADSGLDPGGQYYVGEVNLRSVMTARNPVENILIQPNDVISVPKADLIYVVGSVKKSGGFVLSERDHISVLQAISMAEGLEQTAGSANARIIRSIEGQARQEIPVDVKKILAGKTNDVPLIANDILFIPNSTTKQVALRGTEAAIQLVTGVVIWK